MEERGFEMWVLDLRVRDELGLENLMRERKREGE